MALYINHNMMAMNAARNLGGVYDNLGISTQRLSSGLRINSAADDAAGLAIREMQRSDIAVLNQGIRNAGDAISMIQTADGALSVIDEKLIRMKELSEQAATGTYTDSQREIIQNEYEEMAKEITRIANATDFNGRHLLDGTLSGDGNTTGMKIHFGTANDSAEDYYYIAMNNMTAEALGVAVGNLSQASIAAQSSVASQASLTSQAAIGVQASAGAVTGQSSFASLAAQASQGVQVAVASRASRASSAVGIAVASQASVASQVSVASYAAQASVGALIPQISVASQAVIASQGAQTAVAAQASVASQISIASHAAAGTISSIASQASAASSVAVTSQAAVAAQASQGAVASQVAVGVGAAVASLGAFASQSSIASQAAVAARLATSGVSYASLASQAAATPAQASMGARTAYEGITATAVQASVGAQVAVTGQASVATQAAVASQASVAAWGARVDTQHGAQQALEHLNTAINRKDDQRAELGAKQNRLQNTITNLTIQAEMTQAAESRISDVDVATEMTEFTKNSIMVQAATAMLAQANSINRMAIQLIGG